MDVQIEKKNKKKTKILYLVAGDDRHTGDYDAFHQPGSHNELFIPTTSVPLPLGRKCNEHKKRKKKNKNEMI